MSDETRQQLIVFATWLAVGGGAGILASLFFSWLRKQFPVETLSDGFLKNVLYQPAWARWSVFAVAVIVSQVGLFILDTLQGVPYDEAVARQLTALWAVLGSQITHIMVSLQSKPVPEPEAPVA